MTDLVADTSGLVSLGTAASDEPDPLALCLSTYDVLVPRRVVDELDELAAYDDTHGAAATRVSERLDDMSIRSVTLDGEFPLDDGENAAVTLANEQAVELFLCDEFNQLGLIHAALADTRLVTTPTLLSVFVRRGTLDATDALALLETISDARSWTANSYVQRVRSRLEQS